MTFGPGRIPIVLFLIAALTAVAVTTPRRAEAASTGLNAQSLTTYRTCVLSGYPGTTTSVADSYADQASPTSTAGSATFMDVRSNTSANRRAFLNFDLAQCTTLGSIDTITSATLRLYASALPSACRTHDVFRVTSSWAEATVTWNTQPFGTAINNPATASRTSSITIGTAPCGTTAVGYGAGWDVKADVTAFVAGSATNRGWMIRDDVENSGTSRQTRYTSTQSGTATQAPQLLIVYMDEP